MTVPGNLSSPLLATAAGDAAAFQISRSLRFSSGDSAYLNRTPSSAGSRKKWTWSGWVKRSGSGHSDFFSAVQDFNNATIIQFDNSDRLDFEDYQSSNVGRRVTSQVFRDFGGWYHIVAVYDSDNTTANDRIILYVNGSRITTFDTSSNPSSGQNSIVNSANAHYIGVDKGFSNHYFNGYLAEVNFVDGSALSASDFGEYDSNSVWQPKEYSGTYGTNGFRLTFADNSSNSALGTDSSGNSNTFTVNNLTAKAPGDADAPQNFGVVTYTGTGSSQTISGLNFQPDFVWIKSRTSTASHELYDSVRGATKRLFSSLTNAESTQTAGLTAFNSNGFTLGGHGGSSGSSTNYVAWCWKAGGTASSNTDGTITSSVSANPSYGFSIVSYSGSGSSGTIGHGLNAVPKLIIVKPRTGTTTFGWRVYSSATGNANHLRLDTNTAKSAYSDWNSTDPTSSVFSVDGSPAGTVNASGSTYIAYCFADVAGYQKIGTVNGSGSDQTITTGFCPQYVFFKATNAAEAWLCFDRTRDPSKTSAATKFLEFDNDNAEVSNVNRIEWLADGFKVVSDGTRVPNVSGTEYLYLAIAGVPSSEEDDSLIDTPMNYTADSGNNGGNYATWNPLDKSAATLSNGNLDLTSTGALGCRSTFAASSGKWYFEVTCLATGGGGSVGVMDYDGAFATGDPGNQSYGWGFINTPSNSNFTKKHNNSASTMSSPGALAIGDVFGVAYDLDSGKIWFSKNGIYGEGDPSAGTGASYTNLSGKVGPAAGNGSSAVAWAINAGQRNFVYTPPTNFLSLCTQNLADPTIADGSTAFDIDLYTGTGSTHERSEFSFSPDFVWIKQRNTTRNNLLYDTVRGANKFAVSNSSGTPGTGSGMVTSFDSDGFTVGNSADVNQSSGTFVAWCWDGGTSTVSNTSGSRTSSVRANATAGFSVVKFTGNGSAATVGHGLSAAPELIYLKNLNSSQLWYVYHKAMGAGKYMHLHTNAAQVSDVGMWNNVEPTSSVFTVGSYALSNDYICFCWTSIPGFSSIGSYVGTGSDDGRFVFTGFRPKYIMIKGMSTGGSNYNWAFTDTERGAGNVANHTLAANLGNGESFFGTGVNAFGANNKLDILSNGFKPRENAAFHNASGVTYIYAAYAEHPQKFSRAR
jgi:hypothetical protein